MSRAHALRASAALRSAIAVLGLEQSTGLFNSRGVRSPYAYQLYELRHTQATQLMAQGVDVKTVQTSLGHAKASTTLDFYSHPADENDEKAANLVESLLSSSQTDEL